MTMKLILGMAEHAAVLVGRECVLYFLFPVHKMRQFTDHLASSQRKVPGMVERSFCPHVPTVLMWYLKSTAIQRKDAAKTSRVRRPVNSFLPYLIWRKFARPSPC